MHCIVLSRKRATAHASIFRPHTRSPDKADETYRMGIHRVAQPIDRLKRRYKEYQARLLSSEGRSSDADRQAYKAALASAMAKAQRSMLGSKSGSTSMSANSIRGQGGQSGLAQQVERNDSNLKRPAVFKDADGEEKGLWNQGKPPGSWADIGSSAARKQERDAESKAWKGEVLPQREAAATPKRAAIPIYRDSDEEVEDNESPTKQGAGDVFSKHREPSETDKLRRNPFMHYKESEMELAQPVKRKGDTAQRKAVSSLVPGHSSTSATAKSSSKASSSAVPAKSKSLSSSSKKEKYVAPLQQLYPGVKLEHAGQRSSKRQRSSEVCIEELLAQRLMPKGHNEADDPWMHLDALQSRWLPEAKQSPPPPRQKLTKKDPTVTAFTKAAQAEVMEMFNGGMADSDEESSDEESQSEEEDDDEEVHRPNKEMARSNNSKLSPEQGSTCSNSPQPASESARASPPPAEKAQPVILATPARKPFSGDRKPLGAAPSLPGALSMPRRMQANGIVEDDDEDSEEEAAGAMNALEEELDYMNRPMRELAPLSPITEATEYTRMTQLSRTPATSTSSRIASRSWTSSANVAPAFEEDEENGVSESDGEKDLSHLRQYAGADRASNSIRSSEAATAPKEAPAKSVALQVEAKEEEEPDSGNICPMDGDVINTILDNLSLSLESSNDYVNCSTVTSDRLAGLQKRALQAARRRSSGHSTSSSSSQDWTLSIGEHSFLIRGKLGEGGYGAVFLAEDAGGCTGKQRVMGGINGDASFANLSGAESEDDSLDDDSLEAEPKLIAVKAESPPNRWEFYILGQLRARLADQACLSSIICARKFFCFKDESFLLLEYAEKGTLLEIVNNAVKAGIASSSTIGLGSSAAFGHSTSGPGLGSGTTGSGAAVGIDEVLAMFFTVEVIKLVEALHAADLLHGDLKIDNCLLRLEDDDGEWAHAYRRNGSNGWSAKGITLIDFGRAVDLRQFSPEKRFVADWTPEAHDMPQIQRGESWRHEIDYFGIASIAYCLLFGKYIGVATSKAGGDAAHAAADAASIRYAIDRPLRRYWQVDIWTALFALCLNTPTDDREAGACLAEVRGRMETWLEENCFRAGKVSPGSEKREGGRGMWGRHPQCAPTP